MPGLRHKLKEYYWKVVVKPGWTDIFIGIFFLCSLTHIAYKILNYYLFE